MHCKTASLLALPKAHVCRGFTLIEVMVSLMILSVMSILAWQGLDGMVRVRDITEESVQRTLRLQSVMKQWEADMQSVIDQGILPAIEFDGAALRLTRTNQGGVQVVMWALHRGIWHRWAGPPVMKKVELQAQWEQSLQAQTKKTPALVALRGVQRWQVQFFRGGNWTNAQSAGDINQTFVDALAREGAEALPMGVRTVLTLAQGSGFAGKITRDVLLAPQPGQK